MEVDKVESECVIGVPAGFARHGSSKVSNKFHTVERKQSV
jgi:hypothetical protein